MSRSRSLFAAHALVLLFLALCVAFPLLCVAFSVRPGDFVRVFSNGALCGTMANTALECICSTSISVVVGYVFAYAVVKTRIPLSNFFAAVPVIHLVTPPFVGGLSFILLVGRRGFITSTLLGLDVSLYGFPGLLISQVLCFFPISYLICADTLRSMNPNLEQAARAMGASRFRVFMTVTLPLSAQGMAGAFLFIAVSVLSDFGNPMIVAGRFKVLAVEIYTQLTGWLNAGTSAVLGLVLVVPSVALFCLQNSIMKKNRMNFATIGGKAQFLPSKESSPITRVVLTLFCALVSLAVLMQFAAIVFGAFQKLWGIRTEFTLEHMKAVARFSAEMRNSVAFAFFGALLATSVSCVAAFLVGRSGVSFSRAIDVLCQIPAAVPGSLFGLAFSLAASSIKFRSSAALIVIAIAVGFMPFSYRMMSAVFAQIKMSLDDGAAMLGAGRIRVLFTVLLPVSAGGLFHSFLYDFVRGVGTMSAVIFLVSFSTPLASVKILNLAEEGFWGDAAALALVLTAITFAVVGLGNAALSAAGFRKSAAGRAGVRL